MLLYICKWSASISSESPTEPRQDLELRIYSGMALKCPYFLSELWRRQNCSFVGCLLSRSPVNSGVGHGYRVGRLEAPLVRGMICILIPIQAVPHVVRPECVTKKGTDLHLLLVGDDTPPQGGRVIKQHYYKVRVNISWLLWMTLPTPCWDSSCHKHLLLTIPGLTLWVT